MPIDNVTVRGRENRLETKMIFTVTPRKSLITSPLRSIGRVMDSLTELGPLVVRVQQLMTIQGCYAQSITPELAARSRISHEKEGTVHIQADSAAVAARLRNMAPRILKELQAHAPNLTSIRIGTQPTPTAPDRELRTLSQDARTQLLSLGSSLPDGELKDALSRLAQR